MEGDETDYVPEEPADQEQEETITEPDSEESAPEEPEQAETEEEPEKTETGEPEEAGQEEDPAEEQPEDGETGDAADADTEDGTEEEPAEEPEEPDQETVSGNDLVVSGDVIVFPEDYDLSALGGEPADTESIVQAVERQTDIMTAGFTCTCFMLGVVAGALVIAGFRLRRV